MLHSAKNAKTGSAVERRRKRRCLSYENSQTFAVVRRWLVVCPPHWLLPRISGGQCFFKGAATSVFCRGVRFSLPALASCGRIVRSPLTAPLLYRIKMEFLCEVFEQIENIAVCVFNAQATSANCISQRCRFDWHYFLKIAIKKSAAPGKAKTGAADFEGGKQVNESDRRTSRRSSGGAGPGRAVRQRRR